MRRGRVAIDARKARIVRGNLVAIVAHRPVVRNREVRVIKRRTQPAGCRMAGVARGRVARRDVIGHGTAERLGAGPGSQVAAVTDGVGGGEVVIAVDVAVGAANDLRSGSGRHLVRPGECPSGAAVIELAVGPEHGVMAGGAESSRERRGNVIWHHAAERLGTVPVCGVAAIASSVGGGEVVIAVDVALRAIGDHTCRRHLVVARQREAGCAAIEGRRGPRNGGVTGGAVGGSESGTCSGVCGVIGGLPGGEMAAGVATVVLRDRQGSCY